MKMLCKSILITGCSRGLGFELVKQLAESSSPPKHLIATCRSPDSAKTLWELQNRHPEILKILKLDLNEELQYEEVTKAVSNIVGSDGLNVLVNNAGISPKATRIGSVTWSQMEETLRVNTIAPLMLTKQLLPLLKLASSQDSGDKLSVQRCAILNVSSILGSMEENDTGALYPYRASKSALNAITKSLSIDLESYNVLVTSLHPGWVRTDLGGKNAPLSPTESISQLIRTLRLLSRLHNGQFVQYNGKSIPW